MLKKSLKVVLHYWSSVEIKSTSVSQRFNAGTKAPRFRHTLMLPGDQLMLV